MMNSLGTGGTGDPQDSFVDTYVATGVGHPGALNEISRETTKNNRDDLDDIFKEVDEILENDKAKSGQFCYLPLLEEAGADDANARETVEDWQPEREGPVKPTMKEGCRVKHVGLHYRSSKEGNGMLSAQPIQQQGTVHHLPQEMVGSVHAQNHPHSGFPLNHPATDFHFGPVYNMAGFGNWGPQSRGIGTGDPAHEKKNELRLELEKVLSRPSNAGSWYKFDVLRTELQMLEAPLCGLVAQPVERILSVPLNPQDQ
ncbi:uncharacterized protein LOC118414437 isoform X2 [Branchiostoma floridae]|uniref:Uncharacterized protein LOC118414437 isoform X2 n=1 Tax=Branchiostoma floridae TaxID=7739 RepID=A0A9J7L1G6_BRAFL|nr:uncharacterized protein LOC118414437 isoform X2 [Branchiostoma floridae]